MNAEEKLETFESEINLIETEDIKEFLKIAIINSFDYFYTVPASSSGNYHPFYALGDGGLVRHTKAAFHIGYVLLNLDYNKKQFNKREIDCMLVAIILHDMWKLGDEKDGKKITDYKHPSLSSEWVISNKAFNDTIPLEDRKFIGNCIISHMGQWNTNKAGEEILPLPETLPQQFVHMCDYLASRKFLEFNFNAIKTKVKEQIEPKDFVITFGKKHAGQTIEEIAGRDMGWLIWAKDNLRREPEHTIISRYLNEY